jgi:hypothetical protein
MLGTSWHRDPVPCILSFRVEWGSSPRRVRLHFCAVCLYHAMVGCTMCANGELALSMCAPRTPPESGVTLQTPPGTGQGPQGALRWRCLLVSSPARSACLRCRLARGARRWALPAAAACRITVEAGWPLQFCAMVRADVSDQPA